MCRKNGTGTNGKRACIAYAYVRVLHARDAYARERNEVVVLYIIHIDRVRKKKKKKIKHLMRSRRRRFVVVCEIQHRSAERKGETEKKKGQYHRRCRDNPITTIHDVHACITTVRVCIF